MRAGPRIYNLFPLLVGHVEAWIGHLPRIASMGFDWVYVNPFHYPGFSGSLYAVKEPYRLHDLFGGRASSPEDLLRRFVEEAERHGLRVIMDFVANHTARDAPLAAEHPEWYRREADGSLASPRAVDPDDPGRVTIWGDLAELDYDSPAAREGLVRYWSAYLRHYLEIGFHGFRCDAAYQVPAKAWQAMIAAARDVDAEARFFAETLGCTLEQVEALAGAGFDYIFNSAKWWDFRSDWLLEQYERFRHLAPSIAFPESHDTSRLAADLSEEGKSDLARHLRFHLLFAACFSAGYMMPIGYEFGFRRKLDVVSTRPDDWEEPHVDLTAFVAAVNRMKAACPALNVEGTQRRITAPGGSVVGLLRLGGGHPVDSESCTVTLLNTDGAEAHTVALGPLVSETGGVFDRFADVTPLSTPVAFEPSASLTLEPLEVRVFRGEVSRPAVRRRREGAARERESERRLRALAAKRVVIEAVYPEVDGGRHPVKRLVGDELEVWADIFADGHDQIAAALRFRAQDEAAWREAPMTLFDNDRWVGRAPLTRNTTYLYTIEAWRDLFASWRAELRKKLGAGQTVALEIVEGIGLAEKSAQRARGRDRQRLEALLARVRGLQDAPDEAAALLLSEETAALVVPWAERTNLSRYRHELEVIVDRQAARFSSWYELFPRSQSGRPDRHGTFDDVIRRLPYVREMGFDVLYFLPIHPIGRTNRKGRNNSLTADPDDPGSPYAIGSEAGGHDAVHPELGTLEDFRRLVRAANAQGIEIALDFAIQCSPDHPWIREHPEWFDWRPDGSIKFAENPPKKYEDIVNLHLYRDALPAAWYALRDVVLFWVERGVRIFRVDNPHTKPVPFWEWMIGEVRDRHADVIFLAEAFTRPKMMRKLAKVGFNQSYTYFTWRTSKQELTDYLTELTQSGSREYYRPNFFANTPDINPFILQTGGRPAFIMRAALAATLSSVYGIYSGFELCEATALPGREEYLDSEKYEIKAWDWDRPGNIRPFISRLNRIRRDNPALHDFWNLRFYNAWNDQILLYGKMTATKDNAILVAVNLDPHRPQGCDFEVPLWEFGLPDDGSVAVEDLLSGSAFRWHGKIQRLWLDPEINPCAIWRLSPLAPPT